MPGVAVADDSSLVLEAAPDGSSVVLGEHEDSEGGEGGIYYIAYSRELARSWARDLRAGRLPSTEPEVEPAGDTSP